MRYFIFIGMGILLFAIGLHTHSSYAAFAANSASHPSFSCKSTTAIEAEICNNPDLAARDKMMAVLYNAARVSALGVGASQEQELQRKWLKARDKECTKGDVRTCLKQHYDDRLYELAVAALFAAHEQAMAELTQQEPDAAPVYEAIYKYATIDDKKRRTNVVSELIEPGFYSVQEYASPSYSLKDPIEVASSDKAFAAFIDFASFGNKRDMTLPCSSVVRRPGLMAVLDPIFGGASDSSLIISDCSAMLPGTPALDRLVENTFKESTPCEGTIVNSVVRAYNKTIIAIRLHQLDLLDKNDSDANAEDGTKEITDKQENKSPLELKQQKLIQDATTELEKYYVSYFKITADQAHKDVKKAIDAIVLGPYNECA